jgi:hypothetical protein
MEVPASLSLSLVVDVYTRLCHCVCFYLCHYFCLFSSSYRRQNCVRSCS